MKKFFNLILLGVFLTSILAQPAIASHLGPIIFGKERIEEVVFCLALADAMFVAKQEEESMAKNEPLEQYFDRVEHLFHGGKCGTLNIQHIPLETIYQWDSREVTDGKIKKAFFSIIKSLSGSATIYVLVPDEVPPPN